MAAKYEALAGDLVAPLLTGDNHPVGGDARHVVFVKFVHPSTGRQIDLSQQPQRRLNGPAIRCLPSHRVQVVNQSWEYHAEFSVRTRGGKRQRFVDPNLQAPNLSSRYPT